MISREVKHGGKLHDLIIREVKRRVRLSEREFAERRKKWSESEDEVLAYLPERAADRDRRYEREENGLPQYTTLKVPYSYGIMMAAHTYFTSVFLARDPVFQYQGRHGEAQTSVMAMESIIGYQTLVGKQLPPYYSWLYDVGRYGVGILGLYWDREVHHFSEVEREVEIDPLTQVRTPTGRMVTTTSEVVGYIGNKVYNVRPQDYLPDPRVTLRDYQKGEFNGVRRKLSWHFLVKRSKNGVYINLEHIDRQIKEEFDDSYNDSSMERPKSDVRYHAQYEASAMEIKRPELVPAYEMYIQVIPKEWGLSNMDFPEIWVFTVTADFKTVIGAQPLGARHGQFPFSVIELESDAYALSNRGIPEINDPIARTIDWLLNSHFYNVRAS